jgi:hypothetical protein
MKHIGISISEAIDWTQDRLATTRPLAEQTLFSLLAATAVEEGEDGFTLMEAEEEEILKKHHSGVTNKFSHNWRRYRFHENRKHAKINNSLKDRKNTSKALDQPDDPDLADAMITEAPNHALS